MNYSELISRFWEHNEKQPLGAIAVSLYLFLLEIWTKNEENDFKLSDNDICKRLKITRPTIITLRQKLSNLGMIQYQSQNGLPGHYKILREYSTVLSVTENPKKSIPKKKKTAVVFPKNRNEYKYSF
ncbi:helix-turn-helix domain-containing protein [Amniculibacterium sp. G2-70]|uniref:helix-turn-helix domain-containing protein n=1 Tax=Amniculibacterium sp. G2-70 TaxID=2767188 RepID=UPI00165468AC|nr:helix-turn-helix domain-containing protein [Amniculibacterium sp. G2-70]